jgi:putative transposase
MADDVHICMQHSAEMRSVERRGIRKSAIWLAGNLDGGKRNLTSFWTRGDFASTVGLDEEMVRQYIRNPRRRRRNAESS